ncbi:MAG: rhomboid family intramembrane serine protease [Bacteriovoracia bacterium]
MKLKLTKTFLSKRPRGKSFLVAFASLLILLLFFGEGRENLSANGYLVFQKKEYWKAFTTTFLHADLTHLAHNAFFFAGLAGLLHNYFGFLVFPVLSLIVGGLINLVALSIYPPEVHLVGVSGVIYFMASFWLTLYLLIERRQKLIVRVVHAIAVSLIFFFPQVFEQKTSYLAHGLGFLFGVPLGLLYYFLNRRKIRSFDEWTEINKDEEYEDTIELDASSYHLVKPEDSSPSGPSSDSSQCRQH